MRAIFKAAALGASLTLGACEMTFAVTGMLGPDEKLSGSMTRYDDGGTIELFGGPRTHCVGNFRYRRKGNGLNGGSGTLVCDDRRLGPFTFTLSAARHGAGTGTLSGQPYSFSF